MSRTAIVIGGGIAGRSVGSYLQTNGYDTTAFEMHDRPGGLCTSWRRQGYTFGGCTQRLVGSEPGTSMHRGWIESRALAPRVPGFAPTIEVSNVLTPVTFERHTGNWEGDFEGWLPTSSNGGGTT